MINSSWMRSLIKSLGAHFTRPISYLAIGCLFAFGLLQIEDPQPDHDLQGQTNDPIPILVYYYIWYDERSWDRAKKDYPLLGRYSSDDISVMQRHIEWAMDAGIDGFIVSWKDTDKLTPRLEQLTRLAEQRDFKLAIIYEGLDFYRNPLPVEKISSDLDYFIEHFADSRAFDLFEKPVVIWSGTWEFTRDEIKHVTEGRRNQLLILASEKNLDGYRRLSDLVDGDAYYWSSVNPQTHPGYPEKLSSMSALIHASNGLWIAPAAPGFDARMLGGETVVERRNGETLRVEMDVALRSSPDAIGIISWNEFSENSHIEPSENFDHFYLKELAELLRAEPPQVPDFDSSIPGYTWSQIGIGNLMALGSLFLLILASLFVIVRRDRSNLTTGKR